MLYTCVQIFDVTENLKKNLGTKHDLKHDLRTLFVMVKAQSSQVKKGQRLIVLFGCEMRR
jgi:hypothetical protein